MVKPNKPQCYVSTATTENKIKKLNPEEHHFLMKQSGLGDIKPATFKPMVRIDEDPVELELFGRRMLKQRLCHDDISTLYRLADLVPKETTCLVCNDPTAEEYQLELIDDIERITCPHRPDMSIRLGTNYKQESFRGLEATLHIYEAALHIALDHDITLVDAPMGTNKLNLIERTVSRHIQDFKRILIVARGHLQCELLQRKLAHHEFAIVGHDTSNGISKVIERTMPLMPDMSIVCYGNIDLCTVLPEMYNDMLIILIDADLARLDIIRGINSRLSMNKPYIYTLFSVPIKKLFIETHLERSFVEALHRDPANTCRSIAVYTPDQAPAAHARFYNMESRSMWTSKIISAIDNGEKCAIVSYSSPLLKQMKDLIKLVFPNISMKSYMVYNHLKTTNDNLYSIDKIVSAHQVIVYNNSISPPIEIFEHIDNVFLDVKMPLKDYINQYDLFHMCRSATAATKVYMHIGQSKENAHETELMKRYKLEVLGMIQDNLDLFMQHMAMSVGAPLVTVLELRPQGLKAAGPCQQAQSQEETSNVIL